MGVARIVFLSSELRGFAPSHEPVISARLARGPARTGLPETALKTLISKNPAPETPFAGGQLHLTPQLDRAFRPLARSLAGHRARLAATHKTAMPGGASACWQAKGRKAR
jgi:hypothetical protein